MGMQLETTKLPNLHTNGIQDRRLTERRFASMTLLRSLRRFRRRLYCDLAINQIVIIVLVVHIFVIFVIVHIVVVIVVVFIVINKTMITALVIVLDLNDDIHSLDSRRSLVEPHRLGTRLALHTHGIHAYQLVLSSTHTVHHGRSKLPCALVPTFATTSSSSSTGTSTSTKTRTVINPRPKHTTSTDPPFVPAIPFATQPRPLPQTLPFPSPTTPRSTHKQKHQSA
jgi:hypothetical protein